MKAYHLTTGYPATRFARMCDNHGERGAMRELIMSDKIETGIVGCIECGIEKWSVEWAVIHLFPEEFSSEERRWAQVKFDEAKRVVGRKRKAPKVKVADPMPA